MAKLLLAETSDDFLDRFSLRVPPQLGGMAIQPAISPESSMIAGRYRIAVFGVAGLRDGSKRYASRAVTLANIAGSCESDRYYVLRYIVKRYNVPRVDF